MKIEVFAVNLLYDLKTKPTHRAGFAIGSSMTLSQRKSDHLSHRIFAAR